MLYFYMITLFYSNLYFVQLMQILQMFNLFSLNSLKCSLLLPWCQRRHPRSAKSLQSQQFHFYSDVTYDLFSFVQHSQKNFLDRVCEVNNELNHMLRSHMWLRLQTCNESMEGELSYRFLLKSNTRLRIPKQVGKRFCNDHLEKRDEFHVPRSAIRKSICFR